MVFSKGVHIDDALDDLLVIGLARFGGARREGKMSINRGKGVNCA